MPILGMLVGLILWGGISLTLFLHSTPYPKPIDFLGIPAFLWNADTILQNWWPWPLVVWQVLAYGGALAFGMLAYALIHEGKSRGMRYMGRIASAWILAIGIILFFYFISSLIRLNLEEKRYFEEAVFYTAFGIVLGIIGILSFYFLRGRTSQETYSFFSSPITQKTLAVTLLVFFLTTFITIIYMHAVPGTFASLRFPGIIFGQDAWAHKPWELFLYDLFLGVTFVALICASLSLIFIKNLLWRILGTVAAVLGMFTVSTGIVTVFFNKENFILFRDGLWIIFAILGAIGILFLLALCSHFRFRYIYDGKAGKKR